MLRGKLISTDWSSWKGLAMAMWDYIFTENSLVFASAQEQRTKNQRHVLWLNS